MIVFLQEASTSAQSDAIDIDAAKRKRHHSGNAVQTSGMRQIKLVFIMLFFIFGEQPWHSAIMLDCSSTGQVIHPASGA